MKFAEVTDITIPQGEVVKIEESSCGRILWEKRPAIPKAHWETVIDLASDEDNKERYQYIQDFVGTDYGAELFISSNTRPSGHFSCDSDGTTGDVYTLWRGLTLQPDDIDEIKYQELRNEFGDEAVDGMDEPIQDIGWSTKTDKADIDAESGIWCCAGEHKLYASNAITPAVWQDSSTSSSVSSRCCWSPKLKRFLLMGSKSAVLIDNTGTVRERTNDLSFTQAGMGRGHLRWLDALGKFAFTRRNTLNYAESINEVYLSSDGMNWETKTAEFSGDLQEEASGMNITDICWMPTVKLFVFVCVDSNSIVMDTPSDWYLFTSADCENLEYLTKFGSGMNYLYGAQALDCVYSQEKRVLLLAGVKKSYITRNLADWVEVPFSEGMHKQDTTVTKWVKSMKAFVRTTATGMGKLIIDR